MRRYLLDTNSASDCIFRRRGGESFMTQIEKAWKRIEKWLGQNAPQDEFALPEGASESEILEAESEIGLRFPQDMRQSYHIHNGSNLIWIVEQGCLMPLYPAKKLSKRRQGMFATVVKRSKSMKHLLDTGMFNYPGFASEPDGPIKADWWNTRWIPIVDNECGDNLCVDMDPAQGGRVGQIIDWWHEKGATHVVATSFSRWLSALACDLEGGKYRFSEEGSIKKTDR